MKFLNWIVLSSEDPTQAALTIRGIIIMQIPLIMSFLKDAGIMVNESLVNEYIISATALFGAVITVVGLARKIYNNYAQEKVVVFTAKKKAKKTKV